MENENIEKVEQTDEIDEIVKLRNRISDLEANTVSKEKYKKALEALSNGDGAGLSTERELTDEEKREAFEKLVISADSDRKSSSLKKATDLLSFRDQYLELTGVDAFVCSKDPTQQDIADGEAVAELYRHAIEEADGSDVKFRNIFGDGIKDIRITK